MIEHSILATTGQLWKWNLFLLISFGGAVSFSIGTFTSDPGLRETLSTIGVVSWGASLAFAAHLFGVRLAALVGYGSRSSTSSAGIGGVWGCCKHVQPVTKALGTVPPNYVFKPTHALRARSA